MRFLKRLYRRASKLLPGQTAAHPDMEYIFTKDYYISLGDKYASPEQYVDVLKEMEKRYVHYTRESIGAHGYFSECVDPHALAASLGEAVFKFKNKAVLQTELHFFKTELGGIRAGVEAHFFQERLFMLNYVFPQLNPASRSWLFNILNDKYGLALKSEETNKVAIHDNAENLLLFYHSGTAFHTIELSYLHLASPFWKQAQFCMVEQSEKELNTFINHEKELYRKL